MSVEVRGITIPRLSSLAPKHSNKLDLRGQPENRTVKFHVLEVAETTPHVILTRVSFSQGRGGGG